MKNAAPRTSADRVRAALARLGREIEIRAFGESTRTSADAAAAIGCAVGQIAKSLVFRAVGDRIAKADATFVRDRTGFAIGGVAPVGHSEPPITFIDQDLRQHDVIWAAAGTPNSVFRLTPDELIAMTGGQVIALK